MTGDSAMPRTTKSLTNTEIDRANPAEKEYNHCRWEWAILKS